MNTKFRHKPRIPTNIFFVYKDKLFDLQTKIDMRMFSNPNYDGVQFVYNPLYNEIFIRGIHKDTPEHSFCIIKYDTNISNNDLASLFCQSWHKNDTENNVNTFKKYMETRK